MAFRTSTDSSSAGEAFLLHHAPPDDGTASSSESDPTEEDFFLGSLDRAPAPRAPRWRRVVKTVFGRAKPSPRRRCAWLDGSWCSGLGRRLRRRNFARPFVLLCLGTLLVLGVIQFLALLGALLASFFPPTVQRVIHSWNQVGLTGEGLDSWPTDFTRDIRPIRCHSHNDYWRPVPLYSAISAGCVSVEADVWLYETELYVGHTTSSLTANRTLQALYIDPLMDLLSKQNPPTSFRPGGNGSLLVTDGWNGIFDTAPRQTFTLLIDFKTNGAATWPYVMTALKPLRFGKLLTYWDGKQVVPGPITVVVSGAAPFEHVRSDYFNANHDVFFDAPLDRLWKRGEWSRPALDGDGNSAEPYLDGLPDGPPDALTRDDLRWGDDRRRSDPGVGRPIFRRAPEMVRAALRSVGVEKRWAGDPPAAVNAPREPEYNVANSYYASVSFDKTIGHIWGHRLSESQLKVIRGQIRGAHALGLKVRYWDLPHWPVGLRNHVWDTLVKEGTDLLNVDDLRAATRWDWRRRRGSSR